VKNIKMKLVQIPGQSFEMQATTVTQELYAVVLGCNPSRFSGEPGLPVEQVSWYDAVEFCNHASRIQGLESCYEISVNGKHVDWHKHYNGFRLPTEAEWECACRAGSDVDPAGGDLLARAWYYENAGGHTNPVGLRQPNAWGLYDMLGNVWEWCWDLRDPTQSSRRALRGGSWFHYARGTRAGNRNSSTPSSHYCSLGFRCSRTLRQR